MNKNKARWIEKNARAFWTEEAKTPKTIGSVVIDNTVAVMDIRTTDCPRIGVARCSSDDEFDLDTGLAIAYARMKGKTIPNFIYNDEPGLASIMDIEVGQHFRLRGRTYVKTEKMRIMDSGSFKGYPCCDVYCLDNNKLKTMVKVTEDGLVEPIEL